MKYCLVSLGCQMNASDAERVSSVLESIGFERTESEEDAAILGLIACSVRQRAIDRAYAKIRKWNSWKNRRSLLTFATGCILPADSERFLKAFDFCFPIHELPNLPDMIGRYGMVTEAGLNMRADAVVAPESRDDERKGFWRINPVYTSSFEAYVPIQNGCDKFCSFCAVPYTRGREVSRPSGEILGEVEYLIEQGYKSITLLGQNVNSYGHDRRNDETTFAGLLAGIGELGKRAREGLRVYFTSPHPHDMSREVIEVIAAYECLAKQIHLPLQSGDDEVLRRMNRGYTLSDYRRSVEELRERLPESTLFTDIIVGFPGETKEQFERTRQAMIEFNYNMAYIAMYSPRAGAKSAGWNDDISHDEKKRRLHELSAILKTTSLSHNKRLVGKTVKVLVSGRDRKPGYLSAKTEGLIIVRFPSADDSIIGDVADVEISSAAALSVEGVQAGVKSALPAER